MHRHRSLLCAMSALAVLGLSAAPPASARQTHFLPPPPGSSETGGTGEGGGLYVDSTAPVGPISGFAFSRTPAGDVSASTAIVWSSHEAQGGGILSGTLPLTITTLPVKSPSVTTAANDDGAVVGITLGMNGPAGFYVSANGTRTDLGPGAAFALDPDGEAFGYADYNGAYQATMWPQSGQSPTYFGLLGGVASELLAASDVGDASGVVVYADNTTSGIGLFNGKLTLLGPTGGKTPFVFNMSDLYVAGGDENGAGFWPLDAAGASHYHSLNVPGGSAVAISESGAVVVETSDGKLSLMRKDRPGVLGPLVDLTLSPDVLGVGAAAFTMSDFGVGIGAHADTAGHYTAAYSVPEASPPPPARVVIVISLVQGADALVKLRLQRAAPGSRTARRLRRKDRIYAGVLHLF